jgi:branched-chain amino acid transport system substrate-binding protein
MIGKHIGIALALFCAMVTAAPALAQNEQFIPHLVYRTGAYAPNGIPFANGVADYYKLVNERDGGINGVKIAFEECDTGYATDRGVECYEHPDPNDGSINEVITATRNGNCLEK